LKTITKFDENLKNISVKRTIKSVILELSKHIGGIPMQAIHNLLNFQDLLTQLLNQHEILFYVALIFIIFIETGIVIFPFLPGDSILFFAGSVAALSTNDISLFVLIVALTITAFLANVLNFTIGKFFGAEISRHEKLSKLIKPEYLEEAHVFFEKHGNVAIFLGRFMPIIRTIIPFTAGTSLMPYRKFLFWNFFGGFSWVVIASSAGYFFGHIPFVQAHFELIMLAIIFISLLPAIVMFLKRKLRAKKLA
jgi:membrane-associated protein